MKRRDFLTRCWQTTLAIPIAVFGSKTRGAPPKVAGGASPVIPAYWKKVSDYKGVPNQEDFGIESKGSTSVLFEDNRVYKGIPGSGPQHHVGQVLHRRGGGDVVCIKVEDDLSSWIEG